MIVNLIIQYCHLLIRNVFTGISKEQLTVLVNLVMIKSLNKEKSKKVLKNIKLDSILLLNCINYNIVTRIF